jgi:HSP20 family molecular chaperone IbpA
MYNKLTFFNSALDELTRDFIQSSNSSLSSDYDVHKTEDGSYHIFEVPGFNKSNLKVEVDGTRLTIEGKRVQKTSSGEKTRTFNKSYELGNKIDSSKLEATIEDGILTIFIPKPSEKETKKKISLL